MSPPKAVRAAAPESGNGRLQPAVEGKQETGEGAQSIACGATPVSAGAPDVPALPATPARNRRARLTIDQARAVLQWVDSYSRMPKLVDLHFQMRPADWYVVLGECWNICDNIGRYRRTLGRMLPALGPIVEMMTAAEIAAWHALPDRITLYRGCGFENIRGASWSLDPAIAARFPFLMRYRARRPLLVTATVLKRRVLAVKLDREESEVITFHARRTSIELMAELHDTHVRHRAQEVARECGTAADRAEGSRRC